MWSGTNVDLAQGSDRVVVITPALRTSPLAGALEANVKALRNQGADITIIEPSAVAADVIRKGPVDPANRRPAADVGLAQSAEVESEIPAWVSKT